MVLRAVYSTSDSTRDDVIVGDQGGGIRGRRGYGRPDPGTNHPINDDEAILVHEGRGVLCASVKSCCGVSPLVAPPQYSYIG